MPGIIDSGASMRQGALAAMSQVSKNAAERQAYNAQQKSAQDQEDLAAAGRAGGLALMANQAGLLTPSATTIQGMPGVAGEVFPGAGLAGEAVPTAAGPISGAIQGASSGFAAGGVAGGIGGGVGGALGGAVTAPLSLAGSGLSALGSGLSSIGATTVGGGLSAAGAAATSAASTVTTGLAAWLAAF